MLSCFENLQLFGIIPAHMDLNIPAPWKGCTSMNKGCAEHRSWMELLELKLRLEKAELDSKVKNEIKERIEKLTKELGMD